MGDDSCPPGGLPGVQKVVGVPPSQVSSDETEAHPGDGIDQPDAQRAPRQPAVVGSNQPVHHDVGGDDDVQDLVGKANVRDVFTWFRG